jgi:hypothetical protein
MKGLFVAVGFLVAAMSTAVAQRHANSDVALPYGFDQGAARAKIIFDRGAARAKIIKVNAPGGAYIQCDGPNAPVRCTPDSW